MGLNLALLKENKPGDPELFFFFLKGDMIVDETKTKIFNVRFLKYKL